MGGCIVPHSKKDLAGRWYIVYRFGIRAKSGNPTVMGLPPSEVSCPLLKISQRLRVTLTVYNALLLQGKSPPSNDKVEAKSRLFEVLGSSNTGEVWSSLYREEHTHSNCKPKNSKTEWTQKSSDRTKRKQRNSFAIDNIATTGEFHALGHAGSHFSSMSHIRVTPAKKEHNAVTQRSWMRRRLTPFVVLHFARDSRFARRSR